MKCLVFSAYIQKLQFSSQFQLRINFTKLLTFWRLTPLPELKIPKDFAQILFNAIRKSRVVAALSENEKKIKYWLLITYRKNTSENLLQNHLQFKLRKISGIIQCREFRIAGRFPPEFLQTKRVKEKKFGIFPFDKKKVGRTILT